jgi:sec-independent protein translocase protein TatB
MFNITGGEMLIILVVALVILGPDRIPEVAKSAGRMISKVKSFTEGMQTSVSGVMDDPSMKPLKDLSELAARPRQKLAEYALEAEAEERARKEAAQQAADEPVPAPADPAPTDAPPADDAPAVTETTGSTGTTGTAETVEATATADHTVSASPTEPEVPDVPVPDVSVAEVPAADEAAAVEDQPRSESGTAES